MNCVKWQIRLYSSILISTDVILVYPIGFQQKSQYEHNTDQTPFRLLQFVLAHIDKMAIIVTSKGIQKKKETTTVRRTRTNKTKQSNNIFLFKEHENEQLSVNNSTSRSCIIYFLQKVGTTKHLRVRKFRGSSQRIDTHTIHELHVQM